MGQIPTLRAVGLEKRFGETQALSDAHLDLLPGEIVCLAGENGSGKSTVAKMLSGLVRPDEGRIWLEGEPYAPSEPRAASAAGVAYMGQEPSIIPSLSIAENIMLPSIRRDFWRGRRRSAAGASRILTGMLSKQLNLGRSAATLRPAEIPILELARALCTGRPSLLVLDEVTTRLPDVDQLFSVVRRLAAEGTSVLMITHRYAEIEELADRTVVLRDGSVSGEMDRDDLSEDALTRLMTGRSISAWRTSDRTGVTPRPLLVVHDIGLPKNPVQDNVRPPLVVHAGEIVGLGGLVGSGRSGVLERIYGARPRNGLSAQLAGRVIPPESIAKAVGMGIGFVPEDRYAQGLVRDASLAANFCMNPSRFFAYATKGREVRAARPLLDVYGVRAAGLKMPISSLSGGNAQKVVIARAVRHGSACLLLDEPTRGVDIGARADIYRLIQQAVEDGAGVLLASSDVSELLTVCDRVAVMREGRVVVELAGKELTEENVISWSIGTRTGQVV